MKAIIIFVIIIFFLYFFVKTEGFSTSPGTLLQLVTSRAYPNYWARGSYYTPSYNRIRYYPSYYPIYPRYQQGTYWSPYNNLYLPSLGYMGSRHGNYYRKYSPLYF